MNVTAKIVELRSDIASRRAQAMEGPEYFNAPVKETDTPQTSKQEQKESALSQSPAAAETNELLQEIMRIYTLADNITSKIENSDTATREIYLEIANPYIEAAMSLADVISQYYVEAAKSNWNVTPELQELVEEEFHSFFEVMRDTTGKLEDKFAPQDGTNIEHQAEYIKPSSSMAEKYLKMVSKTKRGSDGSRIVRVRALVRDENTKLFIFSFEEFSCHIAQILMEFEWLGIANYRKAYPAPGYASKIVRKNMGVK
jgi:hypothetical protein